MASWNWLVRMPYVYHMTGEVQGVQKESNLFSSRYLNCLKKSKAGMGEEGLVFNVVTL